MREISYNKKGTFNTTMLGGAKKLDHLITDVLGEFFYIKVINNSDNKKKMIITKAKIKKSFLFIISPPL